MLRFAGFSLCLFALSGSDAVADPQGAWELYPDAPVASGRFEDVFASDESHVWVVALGRITASTDGGASWTEQLESPTFFRCGTAVSDEVAFVGSLTPGHTLWGTTDGGTTWGDISGRIVGPVVLGICGMWAVNSSVVYGVGRYDGFARLVKTTDGGATWTSQSMDGYATTLIDVMFVDELHGFTVGGSGALGGDGGAIVLETTDGGATWASRHVSAGAGEWGWKIAFPSALVGYVSTENFSNYARILRTTDGGASWAVVIAGHATLQGIGFVSETVGWIGGRGQSSFTSDGGETWQASDLDGEVNRIRFVGSTGFAVGGSVYRYFPTQVSGAPFPIADAGRVLYAAPNPFSEGTRIAFEISRSGPVRLEVFDVVGRRVRTLVDGVHPAGRTALAWNGRSESGVPLPSGVYFYDLQVDGRHFVRKTTVTR